MLKAESLRRKAFNRHQKQKADIENSAHANSQYLLR